MSYRTELFNKYHSTHGKTVDSNSESKKSFFEKHYSKYYKKHFPKNDNSNILEIGCNKGYLLRVLEDEGYKSLQGIDLSHEDLEFAKLNTNCSKLTNIVAFEFCKNNIGIYDVIIIKAVLEHIDKNKVFNLIECMKNSLSPKGVLIIDVPNMDWLFSGHERYMDFTHEVGFTKESLSQVTPNFFNKVEVFSAGNICNSIKGKASHFRLIWIEPSSAIVVESAVNVCFPVKLELK